jgi:hypothetical protein
MVVILYWVAILFAVLIGLNVIVGFLGLFVPDKAARKRAELDARYRRQQDWLEGRGPMPPENELF